MKLRRITGTVILAFCGFCLLYFIAVLAGGLIRTNPSGRVSPDDNLQSALYLDNNGRHFDLWIPSEFCGFLKDSALPESLSGGWYGFGWGDRDFFLNTPYADDVNAGILLKALFLPSSSILAVQYSLEPPKNHGEITCIQVEPAQLQAAADFIESCFETDTEGLMQVPEEDVHPSYTGYSFFESRGVYSLFFTSNNWVNKILKKAGLRTGLWTPLTFGVAGK